MNMNAPPRQESGPRDSGRPPDLVLRCVQYVAAHYGRSLAPSVLTAGLPLQDGRLSLALIPKAAERISITADITRIAISDLLAVDLPAILQMNDGNPIVLRSGNMTDGLVAYLPAYDQEYRYDAATIEAGYSGVAVRFTPVYENLIEPAADSEKKPRAWFWDVVRQYRRSYASVLLAAVIVNMIALASPLFIMNVYDRVLPNKAMETLWVFAIGLGLALFFDFLLKVSRAQIIDRVGRKVDIQVACNLIEKILNTRLVDRPASAGVFASRIHEYEIIREFFSSSTLMLFVDLVFFVLFSVVIFWLAGWVVVIPLTALLIVLIIGMTIRGRLADVVRRAQTESALRHSILVESVAAMETIKSLRAEGHILKRWERFARAAAESSEAAKLLTSFSLNATNFVQQLVSVAVVVGGVYRFSAGDMSMGAIIATVMLSSRLVAPLSQVALMFSRLEYVRLAFAHFDEIMQKKDERPRGAGFVNRKVAHGSIAFRNVEFSYPGATQPIIRGLNLAIRPGERVGIIGKIGSGKTTLGRLLTGLYEPDRGEVLIDGIDVRQYHPYEVRKGVGLLGQDAELFIGTVRDNILMSAPTASDAAIIEAARLAGVNDFVATNPAGFDMKVGERGGQLSGGQRQCVALARLFLADHPVLFLDEPSSSMDLHTEKQFIERLNDALRPDQTVIIATHRRSMLKLVDRLLVIDSGMIVRDGSRDAVLQGLADAARTTSTTRNRPPEKV